MDRYQKDLDKFIDVKEHVENLIDKYSTKRREQILFGKWSLRDVVAHLNYWMVHDIDCLEHLLRDEEPFWEPEVEGFNKRGVAVRKGRPWNELYSEFINLAEKLITLYRDLPEELQNKKIWKDKDETPLRFLEEDIRHWEREHIPSLESNLK